MKRSQSNATHPAKNQPQKHAMNPAVYPRRRMCQSNFVDRHPFILEQPVRYQVKHETRLERCEVHGNLVVTFHWKTYIRARRLIASYDDKKTEGRLNIKT